MNVIEISSLSQPGIECFWRLTQAQLNRGPGSGRFIAESPNVIMRALDAGIIPESILCEHRHIEGDAAPIIERCPDIPVYTSDRETLNKITGYALTRGVLCSMHRPKLKTISEICSNASRIAILDGIVDSTNIGAIFRSAAALGLDGILLTHTSCDPLNRRSARVSMGGVFQIPWTWLEPSSASLPNGFKTVAMALNNDSVSIDDEALAREEKLAIILGNEGDGLAEDTIQGADYVVRIPMAHGVDSLNVAAAAAIAFWQLRK